jgi:hypothetical protein
MVIDYTQLGLDFKLYSCQVLFNRALCYLELGEHDLGMTDMWRATREKQTKAHDMLDQALRDKGQDCTVFTVPQGVLYRPAESKVKNAKKKDYLGNSKVIAALDAKDAFSGFQGKSAWQVQMSGPTNVAAVEEPRPMTPPVAGTSFFSLFLRLFFLFFFLKIDMHLRFSFFLWYILPSLFFTHHFAIHMHLPLRYPTCFFCFRLSVFVKFTTKHPFAGGMMGEGEGCWLGRGGGACTSSVWF